MAAEILLTQTHIYPSGTMHHFTGEAARGQLIRIAPVECYDKKERNRLHIYVVFENAVGQEDCL